ncbi:U4/U6.U5 tri-snRNP-associated protein 2 [Chytridiales sp. JEL 0842]|nr:U4/U6.U5 tri-snRNP-associated protein 2 [Chytridiales sp. JEL 0842]
MAGEHPEQDEEEQDLDYDAQPMSRKRQRVEKVDDGLFLETINRHMLDFDFEKFRMQYVLRPTFTAEQIKALDTTATHSYDLNNKKYLPGFIGLNNIKANDYVNVIIQALAHVKPLRDYFLDESKYKGNELVKRFGILMRKIWNPKAFKGQVSPHELLQEISNASGKRFRLTEQGDPINFISWFLNALHMGLGGSKKTSTRFKVPLSSLIAKYDGVTITEHGISRKRMKMLRAPAFLILHIKRFTKNNWSSEKNPTIVNFPIKNLDISEIIPDLKDARYDLVANICHEGKSGSGNGTYKVHIHSKGNDQWFQIQDLFVEEIAPQMIFLSESYIQIWAKSTEA